MRRVAVAAALLAVSVAVAVRLTTAQVLRLREFAAFSPRIALVEGEPPPDCKTALLQEISLAQTRIWIQASDFRDADITNVLTKARERGVSSIRVNLDSMNTAHADSQKGVLKALGFEVRTDAEGGGVAHNKIVLIDADEVITGSYDLTRASATGNGENLLVIHDTVIGRQYERNFLQHWDHSKAVP